MIMRVKGRVKSAEPGAQHFWFVGTLCPPAPEFFTPRTSVGFSINHVFAQTVEAQKLFLPVRAWWEIRIPRLGPTPSLPPSLPTGSSVRPALVLPARMCSCCSRPHTLVCVLGPHQATWGSQGSTESRFPDSHVMLHVPCD